MIGRSTTRIFNARPRALTFEALQSDLWVAESGSFKITREGLGCENGASLRACNDQKAVWYWMHHAVRGHENPALDVATTLGNRLDLPVLVYQGLGGNHGYDSDRHHAFIMQGARDAHRELRDRGVRAVFHLNRRGDQPSPLRQLAMRAAAVVVEDFPAPPFPRWTKRLAERSPVAFIAVDCFCIVPMQAQPKRFNRACDFRRHNQAELERRVPLSWSDIKPTQPSFDGELGLEPLDLERADIAELCAACVIDHSIPPVAHTVGGSGAGYARWQRFLQSGLATYTRDRNDAAIEWPRGVSRLSACIHHGQVSPFRIARDAVQRGGQGAEKFLDERLVWTLSATDKVSPSRLLAVSCEWRLRRETGEALGDFDLLIVAAPAPQAQALLTSSAPELAARAASIRYSPTWALMLALDVDPSLTFEGLFFEGDELGWAARDDSKPGRSGNTWVIHAAPGWARARIDASRERIAVELTEVFAGKVGMDCISHVAQTAHLWCYSLVDNPLDMGALWDPELGLGLCGDWCQGTRIEGAFLSGQAVAGRILGHLAKVNGSRLRPLQPLARAIGAG